MQATAHKPLLLRPVPREVLPCAVFDWQLKFEKGEPWRAPLSRHGSVAKLANAAVSKTAASFLASGFDPRLTHFTERQVLVNQPDFQSGNVPSVCGFDPHPLRFLDPISVRYEGG